MPPNSKTDFLFTKWYLDCAAEDGGAFMGYVAHLTWKAITLSYSHFCLQDRCGSLMSATSLHRASFPLMSGPSIQWSDKFLRLRGEWNALAPPISRNLYEGESVVWAILAACAYARTFPRLSTIVWSVATLIIFIWFAQGVDFPNSNRRFARLV